nr:relaxase/mobilization nuclease domain-containing protein [uncultured Halomonas sp.]
MKTTVIQAKKEAVTRDPPPTVLRGDPAATERLIDSLQFRYRYKSGVLSFAPGEVISPEQEQDIMDRFEKVAFAGLEPDQYNILWVRHEHAGHHELHFVTPRVELTTGKSLNICPPGRGARAAYDDFRSMINAEYGLADPEDPARERDIQHPTGDRKVLQFEGLGLDGLSEAKRRIELRELAHSMVAKRIEAGLIRDRESLLEQVQELGFSVTRSSKNSITLLHPDDPDNTRFKMKGAVYESGWQLESTLGRATEVGERDYSKRDERAAERYAKRVEQHIQTRARYNRGRYAGRGPGHGEAVPTLDAVAEPSPGDDLASYLRGGLGLHAIPMGPNPRAARDAGEPGNLGREASTAVRRQDVSVVTQGGDVERVETDQQRPELRTVDQVKHDGIRADIAERVRAIRDAANRATAGARQCAERARACVQRIQGVERPSGYLRAAIGRLENLVLDHEVEQLEARLEARIQRPRQREQPQPRPEQPPERDLPKRGGWEPRSM